MCPSLAVDIGATNARVAAFSGGKIRRKIVFPTSSVKGALLSAFSFSSMLSPRFSHVCISLAGFVENGTLSSSPNIRGGKTNAAALARKIFGKPCFVENDVKCAALAEAKYGAAKGKRLAVLVFPGSGIGGAVISDGRIIYGAKNACGEFGHMKIDFSSTARKCGCGGKGCFEAYAGGNGIERAYFAAYGRKKSAKEIFTSKNKSDVAFAKNASSLFGLGLANLANALNPDVIIVGGSLSEAYFGRYKQVVLASFHKNAIPPAKSVKIVRSRLKDASLIGAGMLAN